VAVLGVIACQLHENQFDSASGQLEFLSEVKDNIGKSPVSKHTRGTQLVSSFLSIPTCCSAVVYVFHCFHYHLLSVFARYIYVVCGFLSVYVYYFSNSSAASYYVFAMISIRYL